MYPTQLSALDGCWYQQWQIDSSRRLLLRHVSRPFMKLTVCGNLMNSTYLVRHLWFGAFFKYQQRFLEVHQSSSELVVPYVQLQRVTAVVSLDHHSDIAH